MTDTTSKLSAEEAQAIEAISGTAAPAQQGTSTAAAPPESAAADADNPIDAQFDLPVDGPGSQGYIGAADASADEHDVLDEHGEHHLAHGETEGDDADMLAMRSAMLDSAELANRAAGMAAKACSPKVCSAQAISSLLSLALKMPFTTKRWLCSPSALSSSQVREAS